MMACSTSLFVSPCRFASSAPIFGWPPSISWSAVLNEFRQRQPCHLAADVVERADDDDARRVIDDDIHPSAFLEGADVAPLAADDAALHVVAGNVHRADRRVRGVLGGVAVDGGG